MEKVWIALAMLIAFNAFIIWGVNVTEGAWWYLVIALTSSNLVAGLIGIGIMAESE